MKNQASAKGKGRKNNSIISHGEFAKLARFLWLIIFTSIIFFLSAYYYANCGFSLKPQQELNFSQGEITRISLANGMVVLLKENHNLPLVSIFLCVKSGSAREEELKGSGISHFIEHMVFKGTSLRAVGAVFKEIESSGGEIGAFTSYDYTGYKITVPHEFVLPALEILADMVINATFDEQELEKERQVVLKEVRLSYDNPQRYASRLLWQTAYSTHPYKYPILGEESLFRRLNRKDLLEFYQDRYAPNNMILAMVGDLETDKILTSIKDVFKNFQRKTIIDFKNEPEPEQNKLRKYQEEFTTGLTYLVLGYHSVSVMDEDCFALDVLGTVLGEGKSSRLYRLICSKKRLAYSVEAINYTPQDAGLFIISSLLEEPHRKRALSLIFEQIKLVKKRKIPEDELESAKNKIFSDVIFGNQTIEAQARDLALNEGITGDFRFTEKYLQKIREVTSQDILKVANKYLNENNLSIVALIPRDKSAKSNTLRNKPFRTGIENLTQQTQEVSSLGTKEELKLTQKGGVTRYILDNGLTLLVRENKDLPLVSIKAVFKGGLRAETPDTNGLCNLVVKMLDKGTKSKDAAKIAYLVESKGARLSCFSGNNSFVLSLDLLSKDFDQTLALLADLIINPTFAQNEFRRQKQENLGRLKAQEDDIFESGIKLLKATLFLKHPFGLAVVGNEKSLKRLRRRDLINFYRNFCVGKNMVLAVFGDVDAQEVKVKVEELFAKLKSGDVPHIAPAEEPRHKAVCAAISKTLSKKQSLILLGFPGTVVFGQERFILEVICQVLSQASGRLFTQIREKTGLAYTLGAYQVLGLDPGYLVIYVATTCEFVETVKKEILHQLRLLKQEPLSEEELMQAKRAILGERLMGRQTNSACALESSLDELYGLGYNHYLKYSDQINRVEAGDITRCANQYFDLNNYTVVVIGP